MSAVLRSGLNVSRYRAGIVVGLHHDQAGTEDHQERKQIARPWIANDYAARRGGNRGRWIAV